MLIVLLCLSLASCVSTKSVNVGPILAEADSKLLDDCNLPIQLGQGPLTQAQVEKLWITDRISLLDCYYKHKAFVKYIIERDGLVKGKK